MQHKIKKLCTQLVVTATTLAAMFLQKFRQKLKLQVGLGAFLLMLAFLSAAPEASAKTAQTITGFSPTTPITYSTGKTFTLSATGGGSGNPVTYASTTTTICTVAGSTANVLSAGTCMLTANQAGNTHYNAAPQVTANVVINPGSQTITFAALANKTLGDTPFTVSATSSSGLVVAFTSTTSSVCTASATTVTLVGAGTCIIAANQAGNSGYSAAAQVTQSFIVGASISYIYDPVGRLVEAVALNGTNSQYSYDVVGNILASQQHAGAAISITEFIPSSGPAGTTVTIYGSGFNPTPANNTVNFNGVAATVATATATSLSVVVPTSATTGPISVTNTNGTVTSAAPFTVGPSLPAGSNPIAINLAPNQSTSFNFSGVAGQGYELGLTGVATTPAGGYLTVTVTQPSGTTLVTCSVASDAGCVLPYLPVSGTYTVTLTAGSAATTLSVLLNLDLSGVLTANGPALNFSPTRIGQAVSYSFSGTTGQNLSLYLNGVTFPRDTGFYVYKPDGTQLNSGSVTHNSGVASWGEQTLTTLPTTGTYLVRVIPTGGIGGELTIALRAEVTGTLTVDGSATAVSLMAGQHGRYTFTGNAGQSLGLGLAGINTPPASTIITVTINKPDGSTLGSFNVSGPDYAYALPLLSVTGTYSVLVDPGNSTVTFNLLVSSDVTGSLIANGAALNFSPTRVGQAASYTFAGTVGQSANLSMAGDTFPGYTYFTVYKPDGTTLTSNFVYYGSGAGTSGSLSLSNFPVTGTYTVRVTPAGSLGSVSVALNGPVALTVDGAATAVNLTAGRNGLFSFSGNAGQSLGLGLAGISTTPAGGYISVTINKPDGSTLASFNAWGPDNAYAFPVLPATGTYSVQVNSGNNAAAFNLLVSSDATGSLTANGAALNFSPTRVGQAASYTFAGTVGQTINLSVGGDTFPGSTYFTVYKPDGTQLNYTWINSNGAATSGSLTLSNLPVTGTYTVRVTPQGSIGTVSMALNTPVALTVDGAATVVNLTAGRAGLFNFTGSAGQSLGLGLAGISVTPAGGYISVTINKPDGSTLASFNAWGPDNAYAFPVLPVTGTYSVLLSPGNNAATLNLLVSSDATGSLITNGAALNFSPTRVGQAASYTFAGTVGQTINLSVGGDTFPGSTYFTVYKPDGTQLNYTWINSNGAATSGSLTLSNLPVTGTYTVRVTPQGSIGTVSMALNTPVALTVDGAATVVNLTAGRAGLFNFTGSAGQSLGLGLAGISVTPAGGYISVTINKPDGSTLASFNAWGPDNAYAFPLLPVTGTYSVLLSPGNNAATLNLLVSSDATGSLITNGAALNFSPTRVGQAASYTFAGTVGQTINLSIGGDTFPGSTYFTVYKPDGTQLNYTWINSNGAATSGSLTLSNLPVTGTYMVRVTPQGSIGTVSMALNTPVALTVDGAATVVNLTAGRAGLFNFTGSAGQSLGLGLAGISVTPAGGYISVTINKPDGSTLASFNAWGPDNAYAFPLLPVTGTYSVLLSPGNNAATLNLLVSSDATGSLITNGAALNFSPTRVGQAASYTFSGAVGQTINLSIAGDTFPGSTYFTVYKPDGTQLNYTWIYSNGTATSGSLTLSNLPVTGTYTVRVTPPGSLGGVSTALTSP